MKTRRRHELKQNVLDAELGRFVSFFKRHGSRIMWAALIASLLVLGSVYAYRQYRLRRQRPQTQYDALKLRATDPKAAPGELLDGFTALTEQDGNERIAALACVEVGDIYAARALLGGSKLPSAERESLSRLADEYYRRAVDKFPAERLAVARAHFGLAKLAESRRDWDAARAEYETIGRMRDVAGYAVAQLAEQALSDIDNLTEPVKLATTRPATQPATSTAPATEPTTKPAATPAAEPTTEPAAATSPASTP